jgi:uncharacterized protein (TIGR00251 family)
LRVQVRPDAKRSAITGWNADLLKVSVAAPPIEGRANEALIEFLAEELNLPRRQITVLRGATSRLKLLEIDAPPEVFQAWLDRLSKFCR